MAERAAHLECFRKRPYDRGCSACRIGCATCWRGITSCARAVIGVFVRAVLGSLRRRARQSGVPGGRSGAVAIIQRFGAALNLNVHVHALVLDGVDVEDQRGPCAFTRSGRR